MKKRIKLPPGVTPRLARRRLAKIGNRLPKPPLSYLQPKRTTRSSNALGTVKPGGMSGFNAQNLGAQLRHKVASGAITRDHAQQTARERQTFKKAYGDDWRSKVFGKGGAKALGKKGPFGQANSRARRARMLEQARRKR